MNKRWVLALCVWIGLPTLLRAEEKYTDQWIEQRKAFLTQRFDKRKNWWNQWLAERQEFERKMVQETLDDGQQILDEDLRFMDNLRSVSMDQRKDQIQQQTLKERQETQEFQTQQQIEKNDFESKQRQEQLDHMKTEHEEDSDELREEQQETH